MIARAGLDQTKSNYSSLAWLLFTTFLIIPASCNMVGSHISPPLHSYSGTVLFENPFSLEDYFRAETHGGERGKL